MAFWPRCKPKVIWSKVRNRMGVDAAMLEIRAIGAIDNATGDAPILSCLPDQIPAEEPIASVSGNF